MPSRHERHGDCRPQGTAEEEAWPLSIMCAATRETWALPNRRNCRNCRRLQPKAVFIGAVEQMLESPPARAIRSACRAPLCRERLKPDLLALLSLLSQRSEKLMDFKPVASTAVDEEQQVGIAARSRHNTPRCYLKPICPGGDFS